MFKNFLLLFSSIIFILSCSKKVREPVVAGQFYPAEEEELDSFVKKILSETPRIITDRVYAIIVPHAGYQFSAPVAALGFSQIAHDFERVFIIASNHNPKALYNGVSLDRATHYRIPGVDIKLSTGIINQLMYNPLYKEVPPANELHMIEVELPFLKKLKDNFRTHKLEIIPEIFGFLTEAEMQQIAEDINSFYDDKTLLVASMDFSHYNPYEKAAELDRFCINAILNMDEESVDKCDTDGNQVIKVILKFARLKNLTPKLIVYKNSGDITGDKESVVGYSAIVFIRDFMITESEKELLLSIAKKAIEQKVKKDKVYEPEIERRIIERSNSFLSFIRGSFVTIKMNGRLRGCIGHILPVQQLYLDVRDNAIAAAVNDPRFKPLSEKELPHISVEVSVLDYPRQMILKRPSEAAEQILPGVGVILNFQGEQVTFLPDVWKEIQEPGRFLSALCQKHSSPQDCWKQEGATFYTYKTISFEEKF